MASHWRAALALVGIGGWLAGCESGSRSPTVWESSPPIIVRHAAEFQDPTLTESSGVAASRQHLGILWTHNDAGHQGLLFATDTSGAMLGRWLVPGTGSVDWEDIARGPCPQGTCLYIADVGDNREQRAEVTVYRVPEPDPRTLGGTTAPAESLVITYPDRPRDVEAIFVDDSSAVWLVSKGRSDGIFLYRLRGAAWAVGKATAVLIDSLPIPHHFAAGHVVTGASLSADQRTVVIRTYRDLYYFTRELDGRLVPAPRPNRCEILGLEHQGEAVDWWSDSTLVVTSEAGSGRKGMLRLVDCGVRQ